MDGLFPVELAKPEAPVRFSLRLEVPMPRDGRLIVPCFVQDAFAFASLSCPDLLGTCTAKQADLWADIAEERVPSMLAMTWAVARQAFGTMRGARLTVEEVTSV